MPRRPRSGSTSCTNRCISIRCSTAPPPAARPTWSRHPSIPTMDRGSRSICGRSASTTSSSIGTPTRPRDLGCRPASRASTSSAGLPAAPSTSTESVPRADEPGGPPAIPRRIALATHYYASGPAFALERFLQPRTESLLFIAHPLFAGGGPSYVRQYRAGTMVTEKTAGPNVGPVRYLADVWRTVRWTATMGPVDLFIGGDPLVALAGLWLRRRRRTRRVILYSIDYSPRRFGNPWVNRVYHAIDRFVASSADLVWNLSSGIEAARRERDGGASAAPQLTVPLGTDFDAVPRRPLDSEAPNRLGFVGHMLEKQGLQLAISALPRLRRAVPDVSLLVLGDGPYRRELEALADRVGAQEAVEFAGFIDDHREIERRLADCALGLAPYVPDPGSFTRFADPGKVKTYLACGLPVILTDVPAIARIVQDAGAGVIVPYTEQGLVDAIRSYLLDRARLRRAREAAVALGARFAWNEIFTEAFAASAATLR